MASLLRSLRNPESRDDAPLSMNDWASMWQFGGMQYNGFRYPFTEPGGNTPTNLEKIEANFVGYVQGAYKANGVVFACMLARMLLFAEARFQFRQMRLGRPGDLFGTQDLKILEKPWSGGTTGDLLSRAIQDADLAGNFYGVRLNNEIKRLRPDWVTIITGSRSGREIDTELVGYAYQQGGPASGEDPVVLLPEQVAHFAPIPDPLARFRGMSWLTPIVRDIMADEAATQHKENFFVQGAQLGYVVTLDSTMTPDAFDRWVAKFRAGHEGSENAYKTLFLAGGADVKTVGADFQQLQLKETQGAGETRIAAAAGVPPVIVGLSEGLQAATYSNYAQARRRFADGTMRPLWRNISGSLARIIDVPPGSELWYDDRDIPALREDEKDAAEIQQTQAITVRELINAGYKPETVIKAVTSGDFALLKHSGLVSVQLQEPGAQNNAVPAVNGAKQPLLNGKS